MESVEHSEVLVAVGPDQRGIAYGLLEIVTDAGCNIEELRMHTLGGLFAMTMRLAAEEVNFTFLRERATAWSSSRGYHFQLFPDEGGVDFPGLANHKVRIFDVPDSKGLVHSIAQLLMQYDVNFRSIVGDRYSSPHTGEPLYTVDFDLHVASEHIPRLKAHLNDLHPDYMFD